MILDTNALSAIFSGDPRIEAVLAGRSRHHLPTIVVGEYRYGIERSRERSGLGLLLDSLIAASTILPVDVVTASHYAAVRQELRQQGTPIPENDVWIAALARQHDQPVVSRDGHFDQVPSLDRRAW